MTEAKAVVAGELGPVGPHELLAHERGQLRPHLAAHRGRQQRRATDPAWNTAPSTAAARSPRARRSRARRCGRSGAPGSSRGSRRFRPRRAWRRGAARRTADCLPPPRRRTIAPECADECRDLVGVERLERDDAAFSSAPVQAGRSSSRSGGRGTGARSARWPRSPRGTRASRGVGSAQWMSSNGEHGTARASRFEHPPKGPGDLLPARRRPPPRGCGEPFRRLVDGAGPTRRCPAVARRAAQLTHDLGERPVGDALAVGQAAADDDARLLAEPATSSRARRDLPIPAGRRHGARAAPDRHRARTRLESALSSRRRPTSGVAIGALEGRDVRRGRRAAARPAPARPCP